MSNRLNENILLNMKDDSSLLEKKISSEQVFDGRLLKVFRDSVVLPNGEHSTREYIKHNGAVCIVPITDDGKVIVERQFRYPLNRVVTEIPAGKLDSPDEDCLEAAKRELEEETGYTSEEWTDIGNFYPSVAYTTEFIRMYIAKKLKKGQRHLDEDEFLNVFEVPFSELIQQVISGEIVDGKTIAALLKAEKVLSEFNTVEKR